MKSVLESRINGPLKANDVGTRAALRSLKNKYCNKDDINRISRGLTDVRKQGIQKKNPEYLTRHLKITCRILMEKYPLE